MWQKQFSKWKTRKAGLPSSFDVWVFKLYHARWNPIFKQYPFLLPWAAENAQVDIDDADQESEVKPTQPQLRAGNSPLSLVVNNQPRKN